MRKHRLSLELVYLFNVIATVHQAKTHLSRLLHQVEQGEEIVVCRGKQPVASIVPSDPSHISRPKGGKLTSRRFDIPAGAFAPLGDEELKQWACKFPSSQLRTRS